VSGELASQVSGLLLAERRRRGTPRGSRKLTCYQQAVLGLRWFRDRTRIDALARDHGICRATAYRERAMADGAAYVILDGKIFAGDRCRTETESVKGEAIDLWYSGKARRHGGNVQPVALPGGFPAWLSDAEPGSVHDVTAARIHAFPALYRAAALGLPTLANSGCEGAGTGIKTPVKQPGGGRELDHDTRTANALLRSLRSLGERAFALLTQALAHPPAHHRQPWQNHPDHQAALVLLHCEHGYLK
jgi:DDE superfamily endonuclease